MVNIQGPNYNPLINQMVFNAMSGTKNAAGPQQVTAEAIYNLFFKDVKTKIEFKNKIRKMLKGINDALTDGEVEEILEALDMPEQPPFCASYSEEGVSQQLNLKDALMRSDIYDVFLMFYNDLYDEAQKKIR
jgi:hypothetical protein